MPTISFSLKALCNLIGRKLSVDEVEPLLENAKAEVEAVNGNEITIALADTNLPYLWSVEGIARLLKGIFGKEKGVPQLTVYNSKDKVIVEESVKNVRPYIAAFSAKGEKVTEDLLKQIIQLQEKFCHSYGMRRKKVAIGVYSYPKIKFPVSYKAVNPESVKFSPLGFEREMSLGEILEAHPKGKEFAWILEGYKDYPLLVDDKKNVLSFPPIINSNYSGNVKVGSTELFFEATGLDLDSVRLAANIFAYAFADRGFKIHSVEIQYGKKSEQSPYIFGEEMKLDIAYVNNVLGTSLNEKQVKGLLEKMRFGYKKGYVIIPDYRRDLMHMADVVEEIAIAYGYSNIPDRALTSFFMGSTFELTRFIDKVRELLVGFGYQEVFSPILANKSLLYGMTETPDFGTVEIENPMTESYSAVRTWILPQLLEFLSKNKKEGYPQRIFEEGLVTMKKDLKDYERIAVVSVHSKANFTEMKQVLDYIFDRIGVTYSIEEAIHHAFVKGRTGRVIVNNKGVAYIGEIYPKVLDNFGLQMPAAALEMNLSDLFEALKEASVKKH